MFVDCQNFAGSWGWNFVGNWFIALQYARQFLNTLLNIHSWVRETHEIHEHLTLMNNCESTIVKKEKAFVI